VPSTSGRTVLGFVVSIINARRSARNIVLALNDNSHEKRLRLKNVFRFLLEITLIQLIF
jgi:hypothetical protein